MFTSSQPDGGLTLRGRRPKGHKTCKESRKAQILPAAKELCICANLPFGQLLCLSVESASDAWNPQKSAVPLRPCFCIATCALCGLIAALQLPWQEVCKQYEGCPCASLSHGAFGSEPHPSTHPSLFCTREAAGRSKVFRFFNGRVMNLKPKKIAINPTPIFIASLTLCNSSKIGDWGFGWK